MAKFSDRMGLTTPKSVIQHNNIDEDLKNGLWNALLIFYWQKFNDHMYYSSQPIVPKNLWTSLWVLYFKKQYDEIPYDKTAFVSFIKKYFFSCKWFEVYNLIEYIIQNYEDQNTNEGFITHTNWVLQTELAGFRIIDTVITPITASEEIEEIEKALHIEDIYAPVKVHIFTAVQLLSHKSTPDYRNSIKEAISAVESFCKIIIKDEKATLGQALKKIEDVHKLHPALKSSFSSLYGFTSDAHGIRHALLDEDGLKQEDAIYMLVSCSAFINYLKTKIVT